YMHGMWMRMSVDSCRTWRISSRQNYGCSANGSVQYDVIRSRSRSVAQALDNGVVVQVRLGEQFVTDIVHFHGKGAEKKLGLAVVRAEKVPKQVEHIIRRTDGCIIADGGEACPGEVKDCAVLAEVLGAIVLHVEQRGILLEKELSGIGGELRTKSIPDIVRRTTGSADLCK